MIQTIRKLQRVQPAAWRHLFGRNARPYARILQSIREQEEIWITTQGTYIQWWRERETMRFSVDVVDGQCRVHASSRCAVVENFHIDRAKREFLTTESVPCPDSPFSGECVITIDPMMQHQAALIELLRREGVLNTRVEHGGDFFLAAAELDPLLEGAMGRLHERKDQPDPADVRAVMELVQHKLACHKLPLLRVWYHPRIDGRVIKAVFSPRYDVDRAISNMASIRRIEQRYGVESTFYIRAFCPFYTAADVEQLSAMEWCPELALHGEFVTNGRVYGDEQRAAIAERAHLERTAGVRVGGVGMHGGELTSNLTDATSEAVAAASLQYDTTPRPRPGNYLPYRRLIDGKFSDVFGLAHALSDVNIEADRRYGEQFYNATMKTMRDVYAANGVFVLMMHPEYFGFFAYLAKPANLRALLRYMAGYIRGQSPSGATVSQ